MHSTSNATMDNMQIVPRLIEQFIPKSYKLSLSINRLDRISSGVVTIEGIMTPGSSSIILHSKDLDIKSTIFDGKSATNTFGDNDSLVVTHPDMSAGEHILVIEFVGKITDSMHGIYPCYFEHNGIKKELIATQFESHHAREVFPCVDEPEAKATFDVTIATEQNVTVLGNMPVTRQVIENDSLITTFETTPVMSSYLLAWVIGELHKKTAHTKSGVEVNVWATVAQSSDSLDFALSIATRSIDFFDEYFGTPYPLSKCDHVALPDFGSGAMENWGLITYREIALLVDPDNTSISSKHYVATVISHELSHQWFGNLVTMKWWNDLWLNESFASLVEYSAIDAIEPNWNVWLDFASYESIVALRRDSLDGVQSVQTEVNHPDEIGTLFDGAIVYAKGARLLKMLQRYIGEQAFQAGMKKYFKIYSYKNTVAKDLWIVLGDESNKDISGFMDAWIKQPGFPVLHVSRSGNEISLSQERLISHSSSKSNSLWPITLNSNYPGLPEILESRSISLTVDSTEPLRFNTGSDAHFITHYSHELLSQLIDELKSGKLSIIDRLQLLNEQNILASAGVISYAELIPILDAYRHETTEAVWDIICMTIGELKKFVEDDKSAELKLKALAKSLASEQYERLGWSEKPDEPETDTKLRSSIIGLMLYSEDQAVIDLAINSYKSKSLDELNPELRSLILSTVIRYEVNSKMIDDLFEIYRTTTSSPLQQDINSGLTSTRDLESITRLLGTLKDTTFIRTQDTARWIAYLIRNKFARDQTWRWIRDNWDWISTTFGGDKSYDDYPRYAAMALSTHKQLDEFHSFFSPLLSDPSLTRVITIGENEIKDRVDSIERDGESVRSTLLSL